jgi:hypothetical protein
MDYSFQRDTYTVNEIYHATSQYLPTYLTLSTVSISPVGSLTKARFEAPYASRCIAPKVLIDVMLRADQVRTLGRVEGDGVESRLVVEL